MNVKRALFSSWLMISCAWLIIQVIEIVSKWSHGDVPDLWNGVGLAVMPPAIAFGFGAAIAWALSGFGIE